MIPGTYGYARVSKTDDATRNPESQLHVLQDFGIREEHTFTARMTGSSLSRSGWNESLITQYSATMHCTMNFLVSVHCAGSVLILGNAYSLCKAR